MKKVIVQYLILFLLLFVLKAEGQGIKEFYIECDADEFENMYENYNEEIYIPILLVYGGNSWTDVRMRIRGDGSKEYPKKSLKVIFDGELFISGQDAINLNAEYQDKSYLHSVLSSQLFNDVGIDCVNMEHIRLYLNGSFYGLYVLTENVDKSFLESRGYDTSGNLYKATKDGACLSIFDNIFYHWEKKLNNIPGRDDLAELITSLNQTTDNSFYNYLQTSFVYSRVTSFIALNMLLANGSTYYHNYYLYNDASGDEKWLLFPWDLDRTFSSYSKWYSYHRSSGSWTPDNPLLERSIIDDDVFIDIKTKLTDIKNTVFNENYLFPIIDSMQNVIETSVLEDVTDDIPDIETWYTNIEENKGFISERYNELIYQMNNQPRGYKIQRLSGLYSPNESIQLSWNSTFDPNGDNIFYTLYYGNDRLLEDSSTVIISGIADTAYTISNLSIEGKYYFKVEVSDSSNVVPGFDTYSPFYISQSIPDLVINEINYNSPNDFISEDWVEFYNPGETEVNLSGWFFMDGNNEHKFYFPEGSFINPGGYKVLCKDTSVFLTVFPDTLPIIGNMGFGLSSSGELLRLYHKIGYLVDSLVYDNDFPWPSEPNGEGSTLELINPGVDNAMGHYWEASINYGTPGNQNSTYSPDSYHEIFTNTLILYKNYPNPFNDYTTFDFELFKISDVQIKLYNLHGNLVMDKLFENYLPGKHSIILSTKNLKPGMYLYKFVVDGITMKSKLTTKIE